MFIFGFFSSSANLILTSFWWASHPQNAITRFLGPLYPIHYLLSYSIRKKKPLGTATSLVLFYSSCNFCYVVLFLLINLRTYLLTCLFASFPPSLLTYLSLIPYVRRYCWTLTGNFSKATLRTKLSGRSAHKTLNFIMKTYVSIIFHTQINIYCNKPAIPDCSQFTPMFLLQKLENTPASFETSYVTAF